MRSCAGTGSILPHRLRQFRALWSARRISEAYRNFTFRCLLQLSNTKDRENKDTLLHFLVEYVERDHPELLAFADELIHVDSAARVSVESMQKVLKQMDSSIKNLEMDLKNAARAPTTEPDDRFAEAMGAFSKEARAQCDVLQVRFTVPHILD